MKHTQIMDQEMSNTIHFSSPYPARKKRRPQKKRQFGWLQLIVALFICVIAVTALGLGGYLSNTNEAGDGSTKYEQLPSNTEGRAPDSGDDDDRDTTDGATETDDSATDGDTEGEEQDTEGNDTPVSEGTENEGPGTSVGGKIHTVKKGETLYSITMSYYGHAKYIDLVTSANNISDASHVEAGMELFIPSIE